MAGAVMPVHDPDYHAARRSCRMLLVVGHRSRMDARSINSVRYYIHGIAPQPAKEATMRYPRIVIPGQTPAKSNCYKIITRDGHGALAKQQKLKDYEEAFLWRCSLRGSKEKPLIKVPFRIELDVFFRTKANDIDNSLKIVLDILQYSCHAISNDNLCAEIHVRKFIDRENPRLEFVIEEIL